MNHAEMGDDIYELYSLGLLDDEQREEIEQHLNEGCAECEAKLRDANRLVLAMAGIADQVKPPALLRKRIIGAVAPARQNNVWIWATAALAAACVGLLAFVIWLGSESSRLNHQMAGIRSEANQLRAALEFMSRPETRAVQFGNIQSGPTGRVFVSRRGGVVFVGSSLPALPKDKAFELWVIPAKGAPVPAGTFRPSAKGESVDVAPPTVDVAGAAAVAVTVEPLQGSAAPTTKPFLIVPLS